MNTTTVISPISPTTFFSWIQPQRNRQEVRLALLFQPVIPTWAKSSFVALVEIHVEKIMYPITTTTYFFSANSCIITTVSLQLAPCSQLTPPFLHTCMHHFNLDHQLVPLDMDPSFAACMETVQNIGKVALQVRAATFASPQLRYMPKVPQSTVAIHAHGAFYPWYYFALFEEWYCIVTIHFSQPYFLLVDYDKWFVNCHWNSTTCCWEKLVILDTSNQFHYIMPNGKQHYPQVVNCHKKHNDIFMDTNCYWTRSGK